MHRIVVYIYSQQQQQKRFLMISLVYNSFIKTVVKLLWCERNKTLRRVKIIDFGRGDITSFSPVRYKPFAFGMFS